MIKMKKPVINKAEVSPACGVCAHGIISADGESVLCVKTGIRSLDSHCKSFRYDPLKRIPLRRPSGKTSFTDDDFKL